MPLPDFSTTGLLGGMVAAKEARQQDIVFDLQVQEAQQNLFAKSLEIQNYLDTADLRKTERRVGKKKLEAEEELLPEQLEAERNTIELSNVQNTLKKDSLETEELSRELFGLTEANYQERYPLLDDRTKKTLGTTGVWAEDRARIHVARESAINTAAHMRALDMRSVGSRGSSSRRRSQFRDMYKRNLELIHLMFQNDDVYNNLGDTDRQSYLAAITSYATHQQQENLTQFQNMEVDHVTPFAKYVQDIKALADQHTLGGDNMFSRLYNDVTNSVGWDTGAFYTAAGNAYGVNLPQNVPQTLGITNFAGGVPAETPLQEAEQQITEKKVGQGALKRAGSVIQTFRREKGYGEGITDSQIFEGLVKAGVIDSKGNVTEDYKDMLNEKPKPTARKGWEASKWYDIAGEE